MNLQIDDRAGSNKLIEKFAPEEVQVTRLEFGDIAFFGNGPNDDVWYIGIEYKNVSDLYACINSGRFTGTQLPGMMRLYDVSFLLIEGMTALDYKTGQLLRRMGKSSFPMGISFKGYENFLASVAVHSALAGKPCIVKRSASMAETLATITALYSWFQKPWEQHTAMARPDLTKIERVPYEFEMAEIKPGDVDYPKKILRKAIFQLDSVGWGTAGKIADRFGTLETLMAASQKDLLGEKVGATLAERIYQTFHGHPDPTIEAKKRKKKVEI